MIIKHKAVNK